MAATLTIHGAEYELPTLDSMDMDEAMVLYRYSDLTFDQVFELEGLHPGVCSALMHIAIQRSDPSLREREIKNLVKTVNMMDVLEQFAAIAESMPDPTKGSPEQHENGSESRTSEESESGGDDSSDASELSLESLSLDSSGTPDSDTTPDSNPTPSAV